MARPVLLSVCTAALLWAAPSAHAFEDQGGVRLSLSGLASPNSVRLAPDLSRPSGEQANLQRLIDAAAPATGADIDTDVFEALRAAAAASEAAREAQERASELTPATGLDDTGSASALPWYQRFTLAPAETRSVWGNRSVQEFQIQAGARWGVTLGYADSERRQQSFGLEDFSAGAFFSLSDRVRLGGQVRFTSPEDEIFGEEGEERRPEIRFESAFRF